MLNRIFKCILLMCFLGFPFVQISAQEEMIDMKAEVQKWSNELAKAIVSGDEEKILSFYAEDIYALPSYEPMRQGKESIEEALMRDKELGNNMTGFNITTTQVFYSGDLLVEIGKYKFSMILNSLREPAQYDDEGKYMTIWEKQPDNSWKIKADTWNTNSKPWEMKDVELPENLHERR